MAHLHRGYLAPLQLAKLFAAVLAAAVVDARAPAAEIASPVAKVEQPQEGDN